MRYLKCINNSMFENELKIGCIYKCWYSEGMRVEIEGHAGAFFAFRFIDITTQYLRDMKLQRI